jgi:hypothetical protein
MDGCKIIKIDIVAKIIDAKIAENMIRMIIHDLWREIAQLTFFARIACLSEFQVSKPVTILFTTNRQRISNSFAFL